MVPIVWQIAGDAFLPIIERSISGTDTFLFLCVVNKGFRTVLFITNAFSVLFDEEGVGRAGDTGVVLEKRGLFRTEFTLFGLGVVSLELGAGFAGFGIVVPIVW